MDGRTGSTQFAAEGKRGETCLRSFGLNRLQSQVMLEFTAGAVEATCLPARAVPAGFRTGDDEVPVPVGPEMPAPAAFPGLVEVPKPGQTTS
jgi:hypothetical protein